jgi:hypothetical protein
MNGSIIKVVTANDNARGNRANIIVIDEFRTVPLEIINVVFRNFTTNPRSPGYVTIPEYANMPPEENKEIYMSSAYYKSHWCYNKFLDYADKLLNDNLNYFVCGLPYQLGIKEKLYSKKAIEAKMNEKDYNAITWSMENECLFYGMSENAFFEFDSVQKARKALNPIYTKQVYEIISDKDFRYPNKKNGEVRFLAVDIAAMAKKNSDSTSITLFQLLPLDGCQYLRNVLHMVNLDGGHGEVQALFIRYLFEEFDCDYIVIDTNGVGLTVYDDLVRDLLDPETGVIYNALSCMNVRIWLKDVEFLMLQKLFIA